MCRNPNRLLVQVVSQFHPSVETTSTSTIVIMWTEIAQARMDPLAVVEHLDVFKDVALGLATRQVVAVMNPFGFQGAKVAPHHRVIITVAGATHAGQHAV